MNIRNELDLKTQIRPLYLFSIFRFILTAKSLLGEEKSKCLWRGKLQRQGLE